jgi:hypothetical protein
VCCGVRVFSQALLDEANRHEEAIALFVEAVATARQVMGPTHVDVADTLFNMAVCASPPSVAASHQSGLYTRSFCCVSVYACVPDLLCVVVSARGRVQMFPGCCGHLQGYAWSEPQGHAARFVVRGTIQSTAVSHAASVPVHQELRPFPSSCVSLSPLLSIFLLYITRKVACVTTAFLSGAVFALPCNLN